MINKVDKVKRNQTIFFKNKPVIISGYSIVGPKEGLGPLGEYFDFIMKDDTFTEKTFELAERRILEHAVDGAISKAKLKHTDIEMLISGDLLNQIISSSFAARVFDMTYLGQFGACAIMAQSLAVGASLLDGGFFKNIACATASHFATAERQFRFPLELGNQRPPTSQWTATAGGCSVLSAKGSGPVITSATFGKVTDYGITDEANMGAAMAPAAMTTIVSHFKDAKTTPEDYDLILTGDLGIFGSKMLYKLLKEEGYDIESRHDDCGKMLFHKSQKTLMGASGTGCSASVFNSVILKRLNEGYYKKILFVATGALLSKTSQQQGDSIPGIAHAVVIESQSTNKKEK
jgi:stage V sporulation protein AD